MEKNTELLNKALHLLPEVRKTKIVPPKGQSFFEPLGKDEWWRSILADTWSDICI